MKTLSLPSLLVFFAACLSNRPAVSLHAEDNIRFNRDVRAILSEHCFECHGPDAGNRQAELRLDLEADAHRDAIKPGHPSESLLVERVMSSDPDLAMPPPDAKKPLNRQQKETLRIWIQEGAKYEKHWAFMPIRRPAVPKESQSRPIDHFVHRRLQGHDLEFSPEADRMALARRVALDLTGMPPSLEMTQQFLADTDGGAYERLVDRLLQSPHYGEHMALPWLEAARYADTSGYQADWERFMWPWRTWVINAFNDNMPFDQFTIEQLAGDMLPNPSRSQILATGFNRNHRINDEGGVIAEEYAVEYVVDRVDTTSTVWLGLTMGCCRCHDHKYDPLPQQDFYNMFALFNNVPEKGKDGRLGYSLPILDVPDPVIEQRLANLEQQLGDAERRLASAAESAQQERVVWEESLKSGLSEATESRWKIISPAVVKATGGVTFSRLEDGSFLRGGANPATSTYSIPVSTQQVELLSSDVISAFRLEALTHPSLTSQSLAASSNGNFVLSEFRVEVLRNSDKLELECSAAVADFSQERYPPEHAIDGDPSTGWAVEGHVRRENRALMIVLASPYRREKGDRLRIQLRHSSPFARHSIGRFRLSATSSPTPTLDGRSPVPEEVVTALGKSDRTEAQNDTLLSYFRKTHSGFTEHRQELADIRRQIASSKSSQFVKVMVMSEMSEPRKTFVLDRGAYDAPNKERPATPNAPSILGGLQDRPHNRLGFAEWLVDERNPLTARVTVNRFWQQLLGRGLVETVEDFGSQGALPSHPLLLDWLAADFRDNGWDVKRLVRQIVLSQTYRQSSVVKQEHLARDPRNVWLARASRIRLSGYQLRDQAMSVSGLLVAKIGGPSVKPYQPPGLWSEVSFQQKNRSTDFYIQDHGDKLYRRGLYTFWKRSVAPPMLANFDAAGREMCTVKSTRTSTPLQALNLMNDVTFVEAARAMAQRMILQGGRTDASRLSFGCRLLGLSLVDSKRKTLIKSLESYRKYFASHSDAASEFLNNGEWKHEPTLDTTELAAMTAVASVILNLDEVVVRQ